MIETASSFAGSIPEIYNKHLGPLFFEPYARNLVDRLSLPSGASGDVLEVAAGTGIVTKHLRKAMRGGATLIATDLNQAMLDVAAANLGEIEGIEWRQADATALPFPDQSFAAVVCQFGLMFFPDKLLAVGEALRVLKPGGQFLFNVWDKIEHNPLAQIAHETIVSFFPEDPPGFYKVPFGFSDTEAIKSLLEGSGFVDVHVNIVPLLAEAQSAKHAATGLVRGGPVLTMIQERGGVEPDLIVAALAERLAAAFGDHPLSAPMQAKVVTALRP